ncbi:MAG TPA: hypothetical protein VJ438_01595 [Candidatus Nanoarchaeia archaeon]|nr:hypothetical protein [Candidatus Nanoarchaeia archaeon]
MKGKILKEWPDLYEGILNTISYWARWVSLRCGIEKNDASQELLLLIWGEFQNRLKNNDPMTLYGMQTRVNWAAHRLVRMFYKKTRIKNRTIPVREIPMSYITRVNDLQYDNSDFSGEEIFSDSYPTSTASLREERELVELGKEVIESVKKDLKHKRPREYKILEKLSSGYRNCEIARQMKIKENNFSLILIRDIRPLLKERAVEYGFPISEKSFITIS